MKQLSVLSRIGATRLAFQCSAVMPAAPVWWRVISSPTTDNGAEHRARSATLCSSQLHAQPISHGAEHVSTHVLRGKGRITRRVAVRIGEEKMIRLREDAHRHVTIP